MGVHIRKGHLGGVAAGLGPFVLACIATPSAADTNAASARTIAQVRQLSAAVDRKDCKSVLRIGEPIVAAGRHELPSEIEAATLLLVANCAYSEGATQKAYDYAVRGSRLEGSDDNLWHLRLSIEIWTKKYDAAVVTVEEMTQGRGASLNAVPLQWFYRILGELKDAGLKAQRKHLLKLLAADSYAPDQSSGDAQGFHYQYAEVLAEDGDAAGARAVLAGITSPSLLTDAMFDPRLHSFLPDTLDLRAAAEAELARDRDTAARHADRLDPIVKIASDLLMLGRPQEAAALLQPLSGKVAEEGNFADRDEMLSWYWDALGRTYRALARYDDAVSAFRTGAALSA